MTPPDSSTSASKVGFPRLSRISMACTTSMVVMWTHSLKNRRLNRILPRSAHGCNLKFERTLQDKNARRIDDYVCSLSGSCDAPVDLFPGGPLRSGGLDPGYPRTSQ